MKNIIEKFALRYLALALTGLIAVLFFALNFFSIQQAFAKSIIPTLKKPEKAVCGQPGAGKTKCYAHVVTNTEGTPLSTGVPAVGSLGPTQFHTAYQLPCSPNGPIQSNCATPSTFGPQTIAIIDAFHMPTIENDLNAYSSFYNLPACTQTNGCLKIVDQSGGNSLPSTVDPTWALETAMDVEVAHSICQTCKILLVEANSNSILDLGIAANTAANMGATAISNSYGGKEWNGETSFDSYYNHPGVAVTASSGDSGYGTNYPAVANGVVAVGGTTLNLYTDNTYVSEIAWTGAGSGCSAYETANTWQASISNWSQTGCLSKRGIADISAVADPSTGAAVYDSTPYGGNTGWYQVGGTSLSSPIIAGAYALAGGVPANTIASSILYSNTSKFNDILSGNNGACSTIMCNAGTGYDGPTGLGTPNTILGFILSTATPTPTLTPIPTKTPTPTPVRDTIAPSVKITNPLNESYVNRNTTVTIKASATDNISIDKVEFYIGSSLRCTDKIPSYTCSWKIPSTRGISYTVTATAYDAAGNTSSMSIKVTSK